MPQATAVKLAQLGEGDSPQCGEMSRRDKRGGHPLKKGGKLPQADSGANLPDGSEKLSEERKIDFREKTERKAHKWQE